MIETKWEDFNLSVKFRNLAKIISGSGLFCLQNNVTEKAKEFYFSKVVLKCILWFGGSYFSCWSRVTFWDIAPFLLSVSYPFSFSLPLLLFPDSRTDISTSPSFPIFLLFLKWWLNGWLSSVTSSKIHLINTSVTTGCLPNTLKAAGVNPI